MGKPSSVVLLMATTAITILLLAAVIGARTSRSWSEDPTPTAWPEQFHSILYVNYSGELSLIDLWYDWPNGRNFNIIQDQLGTLLYDLEWTNGTSFFYTLDESRECSSAQLSVGILRPNWLDGANYLGQRQVDGFLCNVWEKVEFIWYYEDVVSKRPVHWTFYTGRSIHVMTFEVGAVLEDAKWQAPLYCFQQDKNKEQEAAAAAAAAADDDDDDDEAANSNSKIISDWRRLTLLSHTHDSTSSSSQQE